MILIFWMKCEITNDKILTVKFKEQCTIGSTEGHIAILNGRDKHQLRKDFNKNLGPE